MRRFFILSILSSRSLFAERINAVGKIISQQNSFGIVNLWNEYHFM
ncbi:hypothetical protein CKO_02481 [Citrobacter koseri ATCC BAA-895]|uniref:Uncharacterized protein n=1 Tax=Citrobacter koseri (strain ATCC BAA-895 / CDC 4225-83 / SGSC4696) TaxID=290338 RepID=A8AJD5_CITK8|nr:hypothetical protein CKO_02481 [Citrobacter koseri ATCC BAA-895]KXA02330.1 hypothetical protein HMPREF3220_00991 [Citrobacter koseri]KXA05957.1 hypothetical protein HMPREF3207_00587 [Citrobacter koseri]